MRSCPTRCVRSDLMKAPEAQASRQLTLPYQSSPISTFHSSNFRQCIINKRFPALRRFDQRNDMACLAVSDFFFFARGADADVNTLAAAERISRDTLSDEERASGMRSRPKRVDDGAMLVAAAFAPLVLAHVIIAIIIDVGEWTLAASLRLLKVEGTTLRLRVPHQRRHSSFSSCPTS